LNEIVKRNYIGLDNRTISKKLSDVCEDLLSPEIQKICSELGDYMNFFDPKKISFKREFIASRGVYTAKKRYCLNVYNSEGVEYDPPKIKIMGLEIIRTTTPVLLKEKLREGVKIILTKENKDLIKFIDEFKEEYMKLDYDSISCPTSLNNLIKYEVPGGVTGYAKGTPMHVKSAINFNNMLDKFDIKNLERIQDGDKIKYLILKDPNPLGEEVLGYKDSLPADLDIIRFIDYNRMLDKTFLAPILRIAEAIKWDIEKKATLKGLFR
jgi:DNA polymerase elongation subunit (family B)